MKEEDVAPVDPAKVAHGRVALVKAMVKVMKHYGLNPMELVYAHHEAMRCIGDYDLESESGVLWTKFVVESFKEVNTRDNTAKLVTH